MYYSRNIIKYYN